MGAQWTLSHDFLFADGGAEAVTRQIASDVLPGAPVIALGGDPSRATEILGSGSNITFATSVRSADRFRKYTALYPAMARAFPEIEGNLLASSYAFAHHLRASGKVVVYCHSPFRQIWSGRSSYMESLGVAGKLAFGSMSPYLRRADLASARRASLYIATSRAVRDRIVRFYGRTDVVPIVPPPVDTDRFVIGDNALRDDETYLWVGRIIEPYKRLGVLIDSFRELPSRRLLVAGDGPDRGRLEAISPGNVTFLGWRSKEQLADLYGSVRALIFPSEDDFGITPVEAMACGTPVLAHARGGALDTVVSNCSGVFLDATDPRSVTRAIADFESRDLWSDVEIASYASRYGFARFAREMKEILL